MATPPTIIPPAQLARARQSADAERERLKEEGREEGRAEGVKHGLLGHAEHRRARDLACIGIGTIIGAIAMAMFSISLADHNIFTAGAIVDRVLVRTVDHPADVGPTPPVHPPSGAELQQQTDAGYATGDRLPNGARMRTHEPATANRRTQ